MSNSSDYPPQQPQQPYPQGYPPFPQQQPPKKKRWPLIIGIIVGALVLCGLCGGIGSMMSHGSTSTSTSDTTTSATTTNNSNTGLSTTKAAPTTAPAKSTTKPQPSVVTFGDGTYTVGKDIKPGTYRTRSASSGCYYARLKGFSGSVDDIIANSNTDAPAIVTIDAGDKGFQSTNCGTWSADLSAITTSKTSFGDGMFIVGTDIQPGTYKSSGQSGCYYARLNSFSNTTDSIIANNNTDTAAIITIDAGDKGFQSTNCGTWTKQ